MRDSFNGEPAAESQGSTDERKSTSDAAAEMAVEPAPALAPGRRPAPASEPGSAPTAEPTLADVMSRVGERLSFSAALVICALSVLGLAVVLAFDAAHWRLALFLVATGSFGAWTLSDHERRDSGASADARWRLLQGGSAVLGVASVFVLFLTYLASALGLWIS